MFMHRLLERAPAPTLWAMNDARSVSQTLLAPDDVRAGAAPSDHGGEGTDLGPANWSITASRRGPTRRTRWRSEFAATPGVAAGATAAARISGGGIDTVRRGVRGLSRVLSCEAPPQGNATTLRSRPDPGRYRSGRTGRTAWRTSGERRFSLCLQGPPGTGKSAFVRYLAERMRLEVMQKRASDLMSCWLGGTEQNIAAAFAEARDTGAFLDFR